MRALLYGILALVVLAVVGMLVAPSLIDWNPFKRDLALEVKAATGREVEIAGDLDFALLPSPHLTAEGVRLANAAGAALPDMARIKSLRVDLRFWPLLAGRIEVETMRLIEPTIALERLANGKGNWEFSTAPSVGGASRETGMAFAVERLVVENGTVTWHNPGAKRDERAEEVNAEITAHSLSGPFKVGAKLLARGTPTALTASIGAFDGDKPVAVAARIGFGGLAVDFAGTLADAVGKSRLDGSVKATAENLARAAGLAGAPRALAAKLSFAAKFAATQDRVMLDGIEAELADVRAKGAATVTLGDIPRIEATFAATRLALAPWLEAATSPAKAKFILPTDVSGTLDLTVQLVEAKPGPFRDVKIAVALDRGTLRIDRIAAELPGNGTVALGGTLAAKDGAAEFNLTAEMETAQLRALLESAGLDVSRVPADRLLGASLAAKLRGGLDKFDILDIDAKVDGARLTGGIAVAPAERLGFGASLAADRLDLDAYLARGGAADAKSSAKFWAWFDANLRADVGVLTWRGTRLGGVKLDLTLREGALAVHEASSRDAEGATLKLAGALTDFAAPKLAIERIEAKINDTSLTGSGRIDFSGTKPMLAAKFTAGDIVLAPRDGAPTGRWSRDKFDPAFLRDVDADVTVVADSVSWRNWTVKKVEAAATLREGMLKLDQMTGTLFNGTFKLTGKLDATELTSAAAKLHVEGADVAQALFSTGVGGLDITGGTMALDADLAAQGDSPYALVSTLAGTAEISMRDGTVKGFDLAAVTSRLEHVNDPFDLLSLGELFSTGDSKFASLHGTFKVEGGTVRSEDLTLVAPAGAGSASAAADLPRWNLDAKAEFLLTELKESPPVTVKFEGPLDDPHAIVQSDDLRRWVIRRGLGQEEKKPVVAAKPVPPVEAKPTSPPTKPEPAAPLSPPPAPDGKALTEGLLDGLRR